MEEIGRHFGIADRATLCRATDLALLITRCCGRLPPAEEAARPVIALELACQEHGQLNRFDHHLAAKLTNRPLPVYIKFCDRIVNALLSSSEACSGTQVQLVTIDGITKHFNCAHLVPAIHLSISRLPAMSFPWRCLVGATLIVIAGYLKVPLVPMRVAEYVHVAWRDVQACLKQIKTVLSVDDLNVICAGITATPTVGIQDDGIVKSNSVIRQFKARDIPFLFANYDPKYGRYSHIGINRVSFAPPS